MFSGHFTNLKMLDYEVYNVEFFLIGLGILLFLKLLQLRTKGPILQKSQILAGHCIILFFLVASILIICQDLNVLENLKNENITVENLQPRNSDNSLRLSVFFKLLICLYASAFFFTVVEYSNPKNLNIWLLLIFYYAIVGLLSQCNCDKLLSFYLSTELLFFNCYLLLWYRKNFDFFVQSESKYFVTGFVLSVFFLLGSCLVYANSRTIVFPPELNHLFLELEKECLKILAIIIHPIDIETKNTLLKLKQRDSSLPSSTLLNGLEAMRLELKTGIPAWGDFKTEAYIANYKRSHKYIYVDENSYEFFRGMSYTLKPEYVFLQNELKSCETAIELVKAKISFSSDFQSLYLNFKNLAHLITQKNLILNSITELDKYKNVAMCFYPESITSFYFDPNWRHVAFEEFIINVKKEHPNIPERFISLLRLLEEELINYSSSTTKANRHIFFILDTLILGLHTMGEACADNNLHVFLDSLKINDDTAFNFFVFLDGLEPSSFQKPK